MTGGAWFLLGATLTFERAKMGERGDEPGLVAGEPWGEWRNEEEMNKARF
jgi:hypothetical protein